MPYDKTQPAHPERYQAVEDIWLKFQQTYPLKFPIHYAREEAVIIITGVLHHLEKKYQEGGIDRVLSIILTGCKTDGSIMDIINKEEICKPLSPATEALSEAI